MPKYRQLHLKILDSIDVNEMPDDFTRLTWVFLSLIVDSEGRGVDNAAWIRSKMYPLRDDVELPAIAAAMDWFADRKMITRYSVDGRKYFNIITWSRYQTGTDREGRSSIPSPEQVPSNSGVTPDELPSNQPINNQPREANSGASFDPASLSADPVGYKIIQSVTGWPAIPMGKENADKLTMMRTIVQRHKGDTAEYLQPFFDTWKERYPGNTILGWLDWAIAEAIPEKRNGNGRKVEKTEAQKRMNY